MQQHLKIYIGTIALEKNRWTPDKQPSYRVSDWLERFDEAGFDGIELWENHCALADDQERQAIQAGPLPVAIYNTYASFADDGAPQRRQAAELGTQLQAEGYKFNLGGNIEKRREYMRNAVEWRETLPSGVRCLCECHPGTIMEHPAHAAEVFNDWPKGHFGAMLHPFLSTHEALAQWFQHLGLWITHAHIQLRNEQDQFICLDHAPDRVRRTLQTMREAGFQGSFTIEFTGGTRADDETIDLLWENAQKDLCTLRRLINEIW